MEERPRRGVHHAVESLRRRFRAYTHKDIPPPMTAPYPRAFVPNLSSLNGSQAVPDTFSTNLLPSQADSGTKSSWLLSNRPALVTPTNDARAIKQSSWTGLTAFIVVLNQATAAFDPLKSAESAAAKEDYWKLRNEVDALFQDLSGFFGGNMPPSMTPGLTAFARGIEEISVVLSQREGSSTLSRKGTRDADGILECYSRLQALIRQLMLSASLDTFRIADELAIENRLERLPYSPAAKYSSTEAVRLSRGECTPNTRTLVLQQLQEWAQDAGGPRIYWLNGMAGTGKTTIAYSLCQRLHESTQLAASFFCSRQLPTCHDADRIFPTISYQLAQHSLPFRHAMSRVLQTYPEVHNQPLSLQFMNLVAAPLRQVADALPCTLVVVIDALDESDDPGGLLESLFPQVMELPLKFLVTSRPDSRLLDYIRTIQHRGGLAELRLHELEGSYVRDDIMTYLRTKLEPISATELEKLAERSGVLFIYAATIVRYIGRDNYSESARRLDQISNASPNDLYDKEIDAMYTAILQEALDRTDSDRLWRDVLCTVICAQEPLTVNIIAALLRLNHVDSTLVALRPLLSVLQVSETSGLVMTLHESFSRYLSNKSRSGQFYCDAVQQNARLAHLSLNMIKVPTPPFNICQLESSYMLDQDIPGLKERVDRCVSPALLYACQYWAAHLERTGVSNDLLDGLSDFLSTRLLLWMEVMNLKHRTSDGVQGLYRLQSWLQDNCSDKLWQLAQDALKFVTTVFSSPVSSSTPHIYISALPLWPEDRPISRFYMSQLSGLVKTIGLATIRRELAPVAVHAIHSPVTYVSFSPDGAFILSACYDGSINFWDAYTAELVGQPLIGHSDVVHSVAFSLDNTHIVSGSSDCTIRIWDARTGEPIAKPLEGHSGAVNSVVFSPDGARIVSGSADMTIRIWDTSGGQMVGQPLEGHSKAIYSVACSPAGTLLASGSADCTVRIWDIHTGKPADQQLEGHTGPIYSVAYSPNETFIISGSYDRTIRVWNVHSGYTIQYLLEGHADIVTSVSYSPNGDYITSGSHDGTVRVWSASTGLMIGTPLEGHSSGINSISYSPDGKRVASGSHDCSIRVWDMESESTADRPFEGHTGEIKSVAYSPDGARVASGSVDCTVRIWDAYSGVMFGHPLKSSSRSVLSIAWSPDGACVVAGSSDCIIRVWNAENGQLVGKALHGHLGEVRSVAYSPNARHIVSGSLDCTARIWDVNTGRTVNLPIENNTTWVRTVANSPNGLNIAASSRDSTICIWDLTGRITGRLTGGHEGWINSVAYSPDGSTLVSGSRDCTVCVWNMHTMKLSGSPLKGHTQPVISVAYAPDGSRIVSGSQDRNIRIWNVLTGELIGTPLEGHTAGVNSAVYSPDAAWIASGSDDSSVRIWDARSGKVRGSPLRGHLRSVYSVAFSPDGRRIVSSSADSTVRIWDTHTGQCVREPLRGHSGAVNSVTFSTDGAHIASGSWDSTVCVWDAHTGQRIGEPLKGHTRCVASVCYSTNDSQIISGSWDSTIRIWDALTFQPAGQPLQDHSGIVNSVVYSPDGARIALGLNDFSIRIYDVQSGKITGKPLEGHTGPINSVAFSPDGMHVASGSDDSTIRIWHVQTRQLIGLPLEGHTGGVRSVAYSHDGAYIVSGSSDCTVYVWDAHSGYATGPPFRAHTKGINSVAYSPDNAFIISGSEDGTLRTFEIRYGRMLYSGESVDFEARRQQFTWTLNEDGWLINAEGLRLIWIPSDLRSDILQPRNTAVIPSKGSLQLDFSDTKLGETWHQCYSPN